MLISPSWQPAPGGGKNNEITPICPPAGRRALPLGVGSTATAKHSQRKTYSVDNREEDNGQCVCVCTSVSVCGGIEAAAAVTLSCLCSKLQWIFSDTQQFLSRKEKQLMSDAEG